VEHRKYIGVYYSNSWVSNRRSLATFCLFFDEIHLVTPSDCTDNPTAYLKKLQDKIYIHVLGKATKEMTEKVTNFYQFILDNKTLLGDVIYYHPHLLGSHITDFAKRLMNGGVTIEDLRKILTGNTAEMQSITRFRNLHPEIEDEFVLRVAPTALYLAKQNDWVLIGDDPSMPVPIFSERLNSVRELTSILAEECIRLVLPKCNEIYAEDIMEAREKLKDLMLPFRMSMQKLSSILKSEIRERTDFDAIRSEAKFIAESTVEPALVEIKRKIETEKDKLWIKIFGKVVGWIPFVAKAFASPSPDQIYNTLVKIYGDAGEIAEGVTGVALAKEPGLSFLLGIERAFDPSKS
jgi:hypothetical protein